MTEVIFHFNVLDKSDHVCRYARKAVAHTRRVAVVADGQWLQQIDRDMWAISPTDFLTHCRADAPSGVRSASGVVLCDAAAQSPHQDILVNLGIAVPEGFSRFERLVELVGSDDGDRAASRQRWKFYRDRGYTLSSVDMLASPGRQTAT